MNYLQKKDRGVILVLGEITLKFLYTSFINNIMELVRDFKNLNKKDVSIAGGKGASLGEMIQAGIPVPNGFVILSNSFEEFIKENDLNIEIDAVLDEVDTEKMHTIEQASEQIKSLIINAKISKDIEKEILLYFKKLNSKFVAVRSSATSEDSASAAWAGQLETYLNTTKKDLLDNVKKCWASLFTPRAIFYRFEQKLSKSKISVAVVVQKMIESEESGIVFSVHPVTQNKNQLIIEAGFGLGEAIVSGQITPDSYVVNKQDNHIIDISISEQSRGLYKSVKRGSEWKELGDKGKKQVLNKKEILELSNIIIRIEKHYGFPVDVEWAKEKGKFYIVQSRPITTLTGDDKLIPVYGKVFTRDFSLLMLDVWYKGEAYDPKPWSEKKQEYLPYIIFVREDGTVKSYYDSRGVNWIKEHIKESIKKDKSFLKTLENEVKEKLKPIQPIYDNEKTLSKKDLLKFIKNFEMAYPWVEAMWWLCEMSEEELEGINITPIKKLREKTTKLSSGTDIVVRKSLTKLYPKIKNYVHVLQIVEVENDKIPELNELEKRDKGFIYTENKMYVDKGREFIENKYNIKLEDEKIESKDEIKGNAAYKGIIRGKVRRLMGHKQIEQVREGEIIVSPMTMPDFLPAMKKAAGFITDEGGINCHAAIVAREMKKPTIVGTKIATQILKDGDEIELDANRGIIKILKSSNEKEKQNPK